MSTSAILGSICEGRCVSFNWKIGDIIENNSVQTPDLGSRKDFHIKVYWRKNDKSSINEIVFEIVFCNGLVKSILPLYLSIADLMVTTNNCPGAPKEIFDKRTIDSMTSRVNANGNYCLSTVFDSQKTYQSKFVIIPSVHVTIIFDSNIPDSVLSTDESIIQDLQKLFYSKDGADVKITTNGKTFNVHKCIIAARSHILGKMIDGKSEVTWEELQFPFASPETIEQLLGYIYTNRCDVPSVAVELLKLSHFLKLTDLQSRCLKYLESNINFINIVSILKIIEVDGYKLDNLKNKVMRFITKYECLLIKRDDYLQYLISNLRIENLVNVLRVANTYKIHKLLEITKEFVRVNYNDIMQNENCKIFLASHGEILLEIFEYSLNKSTTPAMKIEPESDEGQISQETTAQPASAIAESYLGTGQNKVSSIKISPGHAPKPDPDNTPGKAIGSCKGNRANKTGGTTPGNTSRIGAIKSTGSAIGIGSGMASKTKSESCLKNGFRQSPRSSSGMGRNKPPGTTSDDAPEPTERHKYNPVIRKSSRKRKNEPYCA